LKLGAKSAPAPADTPNTAPAPDDSVDDSLDNDNLFGGEDNTATPTDAPSNDKPFDDEPFDAGVEVDEDSDPKKFIEQLTGKLGQSLRKYNEEQGTPDFELEKFAINSLLSATHTAEMGPEDQKDIIKKVKSSGKGDEDAEIADDEPVDDTEEPTGDTEEVPDETSDETPEDDDNLFETLDEMSLNDWKSKELIKLYDTGDDNTRHLLSRLISFSENATREEFIKDLEEDHDNEDIEYVFTKLQELGIQISFDEASLNEANIFLNNPPKNNMFQEGSNDILDEMKPCWKGYKQIGMKTKNGKEVPNCVPIDENEHGELQEKLKGLWANIHAKKKRGEEPAKPGDENYPDKKQWDKLTK
jgi:hypothetical protein